MTRPANDPVLPGGVIGFVGGGQLGRMTALAARGLGYRVHALDPNPDCPIRPVCDHFVHGALDDPRAALALASSADVVTCEREDVGRDVLRALEAHTLLRPGRHVLETIQDRVVQKEWLKRQGFPVGPFASASSLAEMDDAVSRFGATTRFKAARGGFDGRGQWNAAELQDRAAKEKALCAGLIAEQDLDLEAELSVLVARTSTGHSATYPPSLNIHFEGALETSVIPAQLPRPIEAAASRIASRVAERLNVVGLLVVELFLTRSGEVLVNELAPRPHNSFHSTEWACETSQFEQLVRAACGIPLGSTEICRPTAIANLYGDLWLDKREDQLLEWLSEPGVHMRLYDKAPRRRRKLGHVACTATSSELAHDAVRNIVCQLQTHAEVEAASA